MENTTEDKFDVSVININFITNLSTQSGASSPQVIHVLGPEYHRQIRIGLLSLMIVISLIGNFIMCVHISKHRQRNQRIQLLFVNLAVADLLVTCFTMTSQLVWEYMGREWVAGAAFCPVFKVLQTFTMVCSNYLIVTIALDRHIAIVYPLRRRPDTKRYLILAWTASLLPSLPNAYVFQEYITPTGKVFCVAKFYTMSLSLQVRQFYMAFIFFSVFILPIFIIVGLYARILYVVWTRNQAFPGYEASAESVASNCVPKEPKRIHSHFPRAKIKTLKMTLIVVATFLATSLPYLIQEMIIAFGDPATLNENVVAMSGIISASNSTINPYVYLLFNAKAVVAKRMANSLCNCCLPSQNKSKTAANTSCIV